MTPTFEEFTQLALSVFGPSCQQEDGKDLLNLTLEGDVLMLFSQDGEELYCRGRIGDFSPALEPGKLLQDALAANYFWQGANGAYLSVPLEEDALYLNERHELQELCTEEALLAFVEDFHRTLHVWQTRLQTYCQTVAELQEEEARLAAEGMADQGEEHYQEER